MEKNKNILCEVNLKDTEQERINEVKSLSYLERLERLMILIEVSYTLKKVNRIPLRKAFSSFS
ncbi:hypothetical protein [Flavobacterium chungangensis]|uniref:Uncharacterized protein n=1 Tax=Flavobacterium chungangensis TaxID=2708132 RepID=A0ABV8ZFQ0_9FLAO